MVRRAARSHRINGRAKAGFVWRSNWAIEEITTTQWKGEMKWFNVAGGFAYIPEKMPAQICWNGLEFPLAQSYRTLRWLPRMVRGVDPGSCMQKTAKQFFGTTEECVAIAAPSSCASRYASRRGSTKHVECRRWEVRSSRFL